MQLGHDRNTKLVNVIFTHSHCSHALFMIFVPYTAQLFYTDGNTVDSGYLKMELSGHITMLLNGVAFSV